MKVYELKKNIAEIRVRSLDREEVLASLREGCTIDEDPSPELIETFTDKEKALEALGAYRSKVERPFTGHGGGKFARVTEYYIEEYECESLAAYEDGDFDYAQYLTSSRFEK